jgi:hypothetical protein
MILTDKAKELFYEWLEKMHRPTWVMMFEGKSQITQKAYFIEWLSTLNHIGDDTIEQMLIDSIIAYGKISEATTEAIKKANEIINLNQ